MNHRNISFRACHSQDEWLRAISAPPEANPQGNLAIPLPPQLDQSGIAHLEDAATKLADRGGARTCPVDAIISVGNRGEMAARLFSFLTGSPILYPETDDRTLESVVRLCANKTNVLISCDKDYDRFGLCELSAALGKIHVNFGFIYPYDTESAVIAAFKAALESDTNDCTANSLINAMSTLDVDKAFGNVHVASGAAIMADRMQEILARPTHIKTIIAHGNGFDFNLGKVVLCCIDGNIPVVSDPLLFPCFQTGTCLRSSQYRVSVKRVRSDFLLMATCWGLLDGAAGLDYARTAYAPLITSSDVWTLMTSAISWPSAPQDWLRIQYALSESNTQGEAARRLNRLLDPLHATFLLFGNPSARLSTAPHRRACLDFNEPDDTHDLLPGFQLFRVEPNVQSHYAAYVLKGQRGSQSFSAEFAKSQELPHGTLLAFSDTRLILESASVNGFGPRPGMETYARLSSNVAMVERLLPSFERLGEPSPLAQRIATLKRQCLALGRLLENRETGNGHVLSEEEYSGVVALQEEWLSSAQSVVDAWLAWSTEGPAARFIVDVWRSDFRRGSVVEGPRCDVCRKPTRSQTYVCLAAPVADRTLTVCRICSMKSDLPSAFELSIDVQELANEKNQFRFSANLENGFDHPAMFCSAVFLMAADRVWPECVSQPNAVWMREREKMQFDCVIPKREGMTPGAHWFAMIGLFDGAPFTWCTKVHIPGEAEHVTNPAKVRKLMQHNGVPL